MAHVEPGDAQEEMRDQKNAFQESYEEAVRLFDAGHDLSTWPNPYVPGSVSWNGFESAIYNLTQK